MVKRIRISRGQPVGLKLTAAERKWLLDALTFLDEEVEDRIRNTPPSEGEVLLTLDELDLLAGSVAAEANHTEDKRLERQLERIHDRAGGQTLDGEPTRIHWTVDKVVMPTVAGSPASGAILVVTGLEGGNIRGQKHKLADGHVVRPDLAIIDDPQTTESAWSESQSARREALLAGDVLGMAGPGKKIAAILCATVIREIANKGNASRFRKTDRGQFEVADLARQ
ncbi:MAG TPA: hypothetical protein VNA25_01540 [Phycisphaerae bacterium]|nr:hypothetical protein [Phycisphaerae bacterium]